MQQVPPTLSFIFDCNIWIDIFLENRIDILDNLAAHGKSTIISSYGLVEILRVLKRIAKRSSINPDLFETDFWNLLNHPGIRKEFTHPVTESFIREIQKMPEYLLIAKIFELEPKDVPYIVLAFQYNAILVSNDRRSLLVYAEKIEHLLGLKMRSWEEFLKLM